ncbi:MAG: transcriptional repressor [Candidatus Brockarchaeota archaeon]|nr:transcriptional repressor [Candidatus Brockarchaeota archaeon]
MRKMEWYPRPLRNAIVEILEEKEALTTEELAKKLKEEYKELTESELDRELMRLELNGIVSITSLGRSRRRVELVRRQAQAHTQ